MRKSGQFDDFCSGITPQLECSGPDRSVQCPGKQRHEENKVCRRERLGEKCTGSGLLIPACTAIGFNQH